MADENTENETAETVDAPEATDVEATDAPDAEAAQDEAPAGPDPSLSPVERRAWYRQRQQQEAKPQRTPQDRQAERDAARKAKAVARRRRRLQEREKRVAAGKREGTPPVEREPGRPQVRQGLVVSAKGDKTLAVQIAHAKRHRKYKKIVRHTTKLYAHDEENTAGVGDTVRIESSRPMSRTKRWRLVDIVERAK